MSDDWPADDLPAPGPAPRRPRPGARKLHSRIVPARTPAATPGANARESTPRQRQRQAEALMRVRLRPERATALRVQRFFLWASLLLLVSGLVAGVYLAATRGGARLLWNNPEYNITTVDVETDGVLPRDIVLDTAEVREGMNIFRLDLDRARARVETLPQVDHVLIQRQLPNKVSILISERKPVAWIAPDTGAKTREDVFASPKSFLVDASGMLLRARKMLPQYANLPIIRNAGADRFTPGQTPDSEELEATLKLLREHADSIVGARFQVDEVDLSRGYGLMVRDRNGLQVLFGLDDPKLQLKTLANVLSAAATSNRRPATISLMTLEARQRNIPVTFQPDAAPITPAPAPEPPGGAPPATVPPTPPPKDKEPAAKKDPSPAREKPAEKKTSSSSHHPAATARSVAKKTERNSPPAQTAGPTIRKALPVIQPFRP